MLGILRKEIHNAQHRILDHREFVNGEINNFLNNFELNRNEIEVETLFKVTETVGELKYDLSDRCIALGAAHLTILSNEVQNVLCGIEDFLVKANKEKKPSEFLIKSRARREQKRIDFCKDLEHNYQRIENSFEEKEEEIVELYSDLQHKLNIPK